MSIRSGKHIEKEMGDLMVRVVESAVPNMERIEFLKAILEHNGYEVHVEEDAKKNEEDPTTWTIGVSDLTFNPVLAVFGRRLRSLDGKRVNAAYWEQKNDDFNPNYWSEKP